jgi:hypothetical protein
MRDSFSSISHTVLSVGSHALHRRALSQRACCRGSLNILNCNVAWSKTSARRADAYKAKSGTTSKRSRPLDLIYQKILSAQQGSPTYNLVTSDLLWMRQPSATAGPRSWRIKAADASLPEMRYGAWRRIASLHRVGDRLRPADVHVDTGLHLEGPLPGGHRKFRPPGKNWRPRRSCTPDTAGAISSAAGMPSPPATSLAPDGNTKLARPTTAL